MSTVRSAIFSLALATALATFLSSCAGAGVVTGRTIKWDASDDSKVALCPSKHERIVNGCNFRKYDQFTNTIGEVTPQKVLEWWGVPKSDTVVSDKRVMVYNRRLAWRGIVVFLIVPIPLLVPLGHAEATFVFSGEQLVHTEYVENQLTAAVCGLHCEGPNGFGCIGDWH